MSRLTFSVMILAILAMASSASAADPCNGVYSNWYNITTTNDEAVMFLVNETIDLGDGIQIISCQNESNHFCYNDSTVYGCYEDDTEKDMVVILGNGTDRVTDTELRLWTTLGDCSGTTCRDRSLSGLSVTKDAADNPYNITGPIGGAQNFSGVRNEGAQAIDQENLSLECGAEPGITITAWVQQNAKKEAYTTVWDHNSNYVLYLDADGSLTSYTWYAANSGDLYGTTANNIIDAGPAWRHIVHTHNCTDNGGNIYVDGVKYAITQLTDSTGARDLTSDLRIGKNYGTTAIHGGMTNLKIYMREWTPTQALAEYNSTATSIVYSTLTGPYSPPVIYNITTTLGVAPDPLYNLTAANFSLYYNESSSLAADITVNFTVNGANITDAGLVEYTNIAASTTLYFYYEAANYSKTDNVTLIINLTTYTNLETDSDLISRLIQNSPGSDPVINWTPFSVIIGDTLNMSGNSTDDDGDALTYHYMLGWVNNSNITGWNLTIDFDVGAAHENETFRIWVMADDGTDNSTATYTDMNVTRIVLVFPANNGEYYWKTANYVFNFTAEATQPCYELIDNTSYSLGNISTGESNNSRYVWYGNHTYNVTCYSLQDPTRVYYKHLNYSNFFAMWNVSIYTENDWNTPLNITGANLSIIVTCIGGESYVYNFTGLVITAVKPPCDVQTVSALVTYPTDSYLRERIPPCSGQACEIRMYMADALIYTILQTPIYMSDYNYFDGLLELYKTSGGEHYTIAQGYFDVEHKYVTYLMKDNSYLLRITQDGEVRDIGYLYAAAATAQYLSLSQISLRPSISLISDNLRMTATFLTPSSPTSVLWIRYEDDMNLTEDVRILAFQGINQTPFYNQTFTGSSNITVSLNNINTTFRYSVYFTVNHVRLGNSPINYPVGVPCGNCPGIDLALPDGLEWLYPVFGFVIILMTAWIMTTENRLPVYVLLLAEMGILTGVGWFVFQTPTLVYFIVFLVAGIIFEMRYRGVT